MRARHNGLARGTPARKPRPPTQMLQTFTFYSRRRRPPPPPPETHGRTEYDQLKTLRIKFPSPIPPHFCVDSWRHAFKTSRVSKLWSGTVNASPNIMPLSCAPKRAREIIKTTRIKTHTHGRQRAVWPCSFHFFKWSLCAESVLSAWGGLFT